MNDALVFDIGGTNLRAGKYCFKSKQLVEVKRSMTPNIWNSFLESNKPFDLLVSGMKSLSDELFNDSVPEVVTIGFPGPITPDGKILSTPTIWGSEFKGSAELIPTLQNIWPNSKVYVINDVSAAGYFLQEGLQKDFCVITVSSGIGSKLFINGKPYTGPAGRGGEIGHWVTDSDKDALICECGGKGHLGGISSGRGTLAFAKKNAKVNSAKFLGSGPGKSTKGNYALLTNELLVDFYKNGDSWTREIIAESARELAKVIAVTHNITGIELFILIGGFSIALGEAYRQSLVLMAKEFCWDLGQNWNEMIVLGPEETEMGLIGAGIFSMSNQHN